MSESTRTYLWVLVVALVAISLVVLYPPEEKLKGGIDLVGGSSLLFEIDTTGLQPEEQTGLSTKVMDILKERVDPGGLMNIEWRPTGNTRLEIRMPRPPAKVSERREAFETAMNAVRGTNVTRFELESALNAGVSAEELRAQFERGVPARAELLTTLHGAYTAYVQAQQTTDATEQERTQAAYDGAVARVLETNLPVARLTDVLAIPTAPDRTKELDRLRSTYPAYAEAINTVDAAYQDWAPYKSDLEDPEDLKRRIRGAGVLEFRILAERDPTSPAYTRADQDPGLRQEIARYVEQLQTHGPRLRSGDNYQWFPVNDVVNFMNLDNVEEFDARKDLTPVIVERYAGRYFVLAHYGPAYGLTAARRGEAAQWKLTGAFPERDPMTGENVVSFRLDTRGGVRFGELTAANVGRQLCIFLDGQAMSHAIIRERIGSSGQISGGFTPEEVLHLVRTLQAGALPARLKETPLMEKTIGPSLGETNRARGMQAGVYGLLAVGGFMLLYYGFVAGGMADVALMLNILFTLAVMALTESTFTLPGIAGMILTVGMAVDANVLIFERIREEVDRGVAFRKALNMGYDKAFSAIFDSNLTTLMTAVILGFLGSEEVKGFAITLGIGIATSMFTALTVTRLVFNTLLARGWLKGFHMRRIIGVPNIDWLAMRRFFWPASALVVLLGMLGFVYVGTTNHEALFDIEFLGGTSVQVDLRPGVTMTDEDVRHAVTGDGAEETSAVAWLTQAADLLEAAQVGAGEAPGQFVVTSEQLTGDNMVALLSATLEDYLERDGTSAEGRQAQFNTKAGTALTAERFRGLVTNGAAAARNAANNLRKAKVQSVAELGASGEGPSSFEIITVETNRDVVQAAVLAALGDRLAVQQSISFSLVDDTTITHQPYFVVETQDKELRDVIGGTSTYDVRAFKEGVAFHVTLDPGEEPITAEDFEQRLRQIRLQPEFEQYQARTSKVFPIGASVAGPGGGAGYREFAVLVVDDALLYEDDPVRWETELAQVELSQLEGALGAARSLNKVVQFAPQIAGQKQQEAIFAVVVALLAIIAYIWLRFGNAQYGLAAVIALVHDVCMPLALVTFSHFTYDSFFGRALGLSDFKLDLPMIAALLTVIGYSLNDTIVIFDRIRENRGRVGNLSAIAINGAINQTLARTLLTSFTTFLVVLLMYMFGGDGIHGFSFVMLVGVVTGSYSTFAVAVPLLYRPRVLFGVAATIGALTAVGCIFVIASSAAVRTVLSLLAVAVFAWLFMRAMRDSALAGVRTARAT